MKRNDSEYDFAGGVTRAYADELIEEVTHFAAEVEAWISLHHPAFGK